MDSDELLAWVSRVFPDSPQLLDELGRSIADEPARIPNAYRELLGGYAVNPAGILKVAATLQEQFTGSVVTVNVPFLSMCRHHFLPFFGTVDIYYVPGDVILGLGKIPRLVDCHARRLQLQEFLVRDIAVDLMKFGSTLAVFVKATARHLCICYRGPNMSPVANVTTYALGAEEWVSRWLNMSDGERA